MSGERNWAWWEARFGDADKFVASNLRWAGLLCRKRKNWWPNTAFFNDRRAKWPWVRVKFFSISPLYYKANEFCGLWSNRSPHWWWSLFSHHLFNPSQPWRGRFLESSKILSPSHYISFPTSHIIYLVVFIQTNRIMQIQTTFTLGIKTVFSPPHFSFSHHQPANPTPCTNYSSQQQSLWRQIQPSFVQHYNPSFFSNYNQASKYSHFWCICSSQLPRSLHCLKQPLTNHNHKMRWPILSTYPSFSSSRGTKPPFLKH